MSITKPILLVDKEKCLRNIQVMAQKVDASNSSLRPHFKTHHSAQIGDWFRPYGVTKCTVSSVSMATYFSNNGWNDITIAFPYNPLESEEISRIAESTSLNILIESVESLKLANERIQNPVGFYIKIDLGTARTGIDPSNTSLIDALVSNSTDLIHFEGFIGHAGHTYSSTAQEIKTIFNSSVKSLNDLKSRFGGLISYGDTPSCSLMTDFSSIDEIRAGNFVFYDWMQKEIGSCDTDQISVCLAAPIVAKHESRNEIVVYGGGVHLSKESVVINDKKCFGKVVPLTEHSWSTEVIGNVKSLSQEHGVIEMPADEMAKWNVGDLLGVIPVHSCLAADLQGHYVLTTGERIDKILKE